MNCPSKRICRIAMFPIMLSMMGVQAQPTSEQKTSSGKKVLHPSPDYSPGQVIRLQLEALADNDAPHKDAGIEVAFRFASPANKTVTGPLDRFIQMVHNPIYRPMLHHRTARYGELQISGNEAMQSVILTAADGERVGYIFILSKQKGGPCDECWMTDSVLRFAVQEI